MADRGLVAAISEKGKPAPLVATRRWVVERTNSWHNAHKEKLAWCTERCGQVIDFWVALSDVVIIVRRLAGKAGAATVGKASLPDDHDLLAEVLTGGCR